MQIVEKYRHTVQMYTDICHNDFFFFYIATEPLVFIGYASNHTPRTRVNIKLRDDAEYSI